jgi:hypothetical protein
MPDLAFLLDLTFLPNLAFHPIIVHPSVHPPNPHTPTLSPLSVILPHAVGARRGGQVAVVRVLVLSVSCGCIEKHIKLTDGTKRLL